MRTGLIAAATLFLIIATAAAGYFSGCWRFNHPSPSEFQIRGLDGSHHQGPIDWPAAAKDGQRFAYIKATEGGDFKDPRFQSNWSAAKQSGLAFGAYHFFTFCKPGAEQARNFTSAVPDDAAALPPVVDFEFVGNCAARPPQDVLLKELTAYTDIVRAKYHKEPMLYVTRAAYARYLEGQGGRYRLWVRDVFRRPGRIDAHEWTIWQYADNARVKGILGLTDQNVFNGNEKDFLRFAKKAEASK